MGKASEIWKEIKPKIGEMLVAVNDIETQAEKAQEEAYQRGLNDAWEAARKIYLPTEYGGIHADVKRQIFNNTSASGIFKKVSASEAIEKIRQYEQEQEEQIQVGDEVRNIRSGWTAVVARISDDDCLTLMDGNGAVADGYEITRFTKTGRHFPEIAAVLQKMKEES